jgi:hypothetical protein
MEILPRHTQNQPDETHSTQHEADHNHRTKGVGLDFERVIDWRNGIDEIIKSAAFDLVQNYFHNNFDSIGQANIFRRETGFFTDSGCPVF